MKVMAYTVDYGSKKTVEFSSWCCFDFYNSRNAQSSSPNSFMIHVKFSHTLYMRNGDISLSFP